MNNNESDTKQKRSSRNSATAAGTTSDAKSRNWRFLFDNLKRAVGYIYSMCEQDGNIEECQEAIMVLHNRIREFEGLKQYIEVQANYETSEERPSSVAWEVPVSAIKQPSLPFQANGDPQLYYYPYLPQAPFPQYPVPNTFPMMDPNLVNFVPFNQQFPGFPPDFLPPPGGNPPPPPNNYQYNNYPDYNSNKKNYTKHRRSGSKHEKQHRNHEKKHHNNLNSLDDIQITCVESTVNCMSGGSYEEVQVSQSKDYKPPEERKKEDQPSPIIHDNVLIEDLTDAIKEDTLPAEPDSDKQEWTVVNNDTYVNVTSDGSDHSLPASPELAKVGKKPESCKDDESKTHPTLDSPTEPKSGVEAASSIDDESAISNVEKKIIQTDELTAVDTSKSSTDQLTVADTRESSNESAPAAMDAPVEEDAQSEANEAANSILNSEASDTTPADDDCEPNTTLDVPTLDVEPDKVDEPVDTNVITPADDGAEAPDAAEDKVEDVESVTESSSSTNKKLVTAEPVVVTAEPEVVTASDTGVLSSSSVQEDESVINESLDTKTMSEANKGGDGPEELGIEKSNTLVLSDSIEGPASGETAKDLPKDSDSFAKPSSPTKRTKHSTSSETTDGDVKEVDVLSESGLSTISSSSVRSCISLPPNPLARSTSWADLVRKGNSQSPAPTTRKVTAASKYQSTPSRYLSHAQNSTPKVKKETPQLLSKSRSLPQRSSTSNKAPPVKKLLSKPKEPHVCEDGWSVSSGKSRVKTIPNSFRKAEQKTPTLQAKSSENAKSPVSSPRLTTKSKTDPLKSKVTETSQPKSKTATEGKVTRPLKSKTTLKSTTPSKTCSPVSKPSAKVTSASKTTTAATKVKRVTSTTPSSKGPKTGSKVLTKARSLESNTKLSDKLKPETAKKGVSKSTDTLQKVSTEKKKVPPKSLVISDKKPVPDVGVPGEMAQEVLKVVPQELPQDLPQVVPQVVLQSNEEPTPETLIQVTPDDMETLIQVTPDNLNSIAQVTPDTLDTIVTTAVINKESSGSSEEDTSSHKSIQTEQEEPFASIYSSPISEEECAAYRAIMSKRKRQISEQSSLSTDTLEEDERMSPVRSPSSRSSGRSPGKAPQLHQRLSSPSRRRNTTDTVLKNYQEKLAKAEEQRDRIQKERANKLKRIKIKEEQIRGLQEQQEKERVARGISNAEKLLRAEQLREERIMEIKRKAQEEEQKVSEIAFINSLEAQNRKMELLSKEQMAEAKRVEIQVRQQEERKRRSEELQAKEDAVLERKQAIEADRLARIAHLENKIQESQAKVDSNKMSMETAAKEAAKEKELERHMTLELARHDRSSPLADRSHSNSVERRSKGSRQQSSTKLKEMQATAALLCRQQYPDYLPAHVLYDPPKWCTKCNITIVSEAVLMAHMIKRHQKTSQVEAEVESQYIVDYSDELCPPASDIINRQKQLRKRAKKVKSRITNKLSLLAPVQPVEAAKDCPNKNRLFKCIKAINNVKSREKGLVDLSRTVLMETDINHLIEKGVVGQVCDLLSQKQTLLPISKLLLAFSTKSKTGSNICVRWLPQIIECLESVNSLLSRPLHANLLKLTSTLLSSLPPCDVLTSDVVSYIVSREVVDSIQTTCTKTTHLQDEAECEVLVNSLELLSACCVVMTPPNSLLSVVPHKSDPSQILDALVFTKACNIITLLYGVLLYDGPKRSGPPLSALAQRVVKQCLNTLLSIARLSLQTLQFVMDSEGMSLEMRHVCSYIICSASSHGYTDILDACVQLIGYVVFLHPANQVLLQNGPSPSILQLLSSLPFLYFSDIHSMNLLFPTLISACYECPSNLAILQEKVNKVMLIAYLKDQSTSDAHLYPRDVFQKALKFLEYPT